MDMNHTTLIHHGALCAFEYSYDSKQFCIDAKSGY
jgi:hypothetical protein